MDVVLPKLYVKQSGALYGLGAAAADATVWLYNGPDGKFSNQRFEELKKVLYDALANADQQFQTVEKTARDAANALGIAKFSPTITAGQSVLRSLPAARKVLTDLRKQLDIAVRDLKNGLWNGTPGTSGFTGYQKFINSVQVELNGFVQDMGVLNASIDQSFLSALSDRALVMVKEAYDYAGKAGAGALDLIENAAKTAKDNLESGLWLARNWWKVLLGGVVLFYGVPLILRTRREGARGLEEGLRSGRSSIENAAKKGAALATKAGAAYASGGASLAVSGLRKRRAARKMR
jgi:hypothetical protein